MIMFGSDGYFLNPVLVNCPICLDIKVLSSMNPPWSLFRDMHHKNPPGRSLNKCLNAWRMTSSLKKHLPNKELFLVDWLLRFLEGRPSKFLLNKLRIRYLTLEILYVLLSFYFLIMNFYCKYSVLNFRFYLF